jgi:hypothetical protein
VGIAVKRDLLADAFVLDQSAVALTVCSSYCKLRACFMKMAIALLNQPCGQKTGG